MKWLRLIAVIVLVIVIVVPLLLAGLMRLFQQLSRPADVARAAAAGAELAGVRGKTVIAVVAHPDDTEFFASGTLGALKRNDNRVVIVVGTSGEKGGTAPDLGKTREAEQLAAAKVMSYDEVNFLRYPDRGLGDAKEFPDRLREIFREERPDILFTFDIEKEGLVYHHADHRGAGKAALAVARESDFVKEAYLFHTSAPDVIFDIAATGNLKAGAISKHVSQQSGNGNPMMRFLLPILRGGRRASAEEKRSFRGFSQAYPEAGVRAAELFRHVEL